MIRRALLSLICFLFVGSLQGRADERKEALDRQSYELYQQVFSPFCPGRSLNDCPSSKAHELKLEMRAQLENGVPPQTILEGVFAKFGEKYRAVPAYQGFGKLVWWVPLGFVLIGLVAAGALVVRRGRREVGARTLASSTSAKPHISADIQAQLERELSELE